MEKPNMLLTALREAPMIAAVKNEDGLKQALSSDCAVIFFLYGTICTIPNLVAQAKQAGKLAFVHIDLVDGLSAKDVAADFIRTVTAADGIISTRPNIIRKGREIGLITIQRFFLLDSLAFENIIHQSITADMVDILPGVMPKTIRRLVSQIAQPVIASGLISDKEDIISALSAGAVAVSATSSPLWFL